MDTSTVLDASGDIVWSDIVIVEAHKNLGVFVVQSLNWFIMF